MGSRSKVAHSPETPIQAKPCPRTYMVLSQVLCACLSLYMATLLGLTRVAFSTTDEKQRIQILCT